MRPILTSVTAPMLLTLFVMAGCATTKEELLPHGPSTMADIWDRGVGATTDNSRRAERVLEARLALRRPLLPDELLAASTIATSYTRTAANEIVSQFKRLPNPDLIMYVYPHLAGSEAAPVPGYTTVFPLHQRVHYALPGERVDEY